MPSSLVMAPWLTERGTRLSLFADKFRRRKHVEHMLDTVCLALDMRHQTTKALAAKRANCEELRDALSDELLPLAYRYFAEFNATAEQSLPPPVAAAASATVAGRDAQQPKGDRPSNAKQRLVDLSQLSLYKLIKLAESAGVAAGAVEDAAEHADRATLAVLVLEAEQAAQQDASSSAMGSVTEVAVVVAMDGPQAEAALVAAWRGGQPTPIAPLAEATEAICVVATEMCRGEERHSSGKKKKPKAKKKKKRQV